MRWYAPHLSRDPLGEAGGLNLYAFVGNNPVNWVDTWGLRLKYQGDVARIQTGITVLENNSRTAKIIIGILKTVGTEITIQTGQTNQYDPKTNTITWNPGKNFIYDGSEAWHYRFPEIGLSHEAIHALHDMQKNLLPRKDEENSTVGIGKYQKTPINENRIRNEMGCNTRPQY